MRLAERGKLALALRVLGFLLTLLLSLSATGVSALEVPELRAHVNDSAGLLTSDEQRALESKLMSHEQATGQQFVLLVVPSLEDDALEDFSLRVVEKWKLGAKKVDNGLLMLVIPNDRKMRIEVGYGLEGEITDAFSASIIREVMAPAFRQNAYAAGIDRAFDLLMAKAQGIAVSPPQPSARKKAGEHFPWILLIIIGVLVLSKIFPGGRGGRRRGSSVFWMGPGFGGGGGGWGGGGGGWGGGGGGGFGGGGASGDW